MTTLKGKRVLITGGTTGIGRAIGIALAKRGARIFTFGRHQKELDDGLEAIRAHDPGAKGVVADAARPEDVERVVEASDEALGGLDILIANAGISGEGVADLGDSEWRYVLATNLSGYLAFSKAAAERMKAGGRIVMIGSVSADSRSKDTSTYAATKAAVQAFAEAFGKEMAPRNILVSLIEPGTVGSDMQGEPEPQRVKIKEHKMLYAEDIADYVAFLVTRPSRVNVSTATIIPRLQHEGSD